MPDTTGIMGVTSLSGASDALRMLSNAASRTSRESQGAQGFPGSAPRNANGQDFGTVIDATAMSIMAGAMAPQAQAGMITPPMVTEARSYTTVEITTRSTSARGNDYTQPTGMSQTRGAEGEEKLDGESAFGGRLDAALSDAGAQMQENTAQALNVTEEQVTFAMGQAGLNPLDLLTEEGLTDLVMEVTGEDQAALLTDEDLYAALQTLFEDAEALKTGIAEEFALPAEGIEDAIALTVSQQTEAVPAEAETETENLFAFAEHAGDETQLLQDARPNRAEHGVQEEESAEGLSVRGERTVQEGVQQTQNPEAGQGKGGENAGAHSAKTAPREAESAPAGIVNQAQTFVNTVNDALNATQVLYGSGAQGSTQAQDVLRQVLEMMRTNIREGMTEVDMQLHPQSLGRVNVNLQALDGGEVIARFIAQNETVREALASQMPQLLQRFEEQGIKVNEVQVMVSQDGFNQSRDNETRREDQRNEQQQGIERTGRMRRVQMDLAGMTAEDIANLDEDERIEAEMMAAEGTTVNYRA